MSPQFSNLLPKIGVISITSVIMFALTVVICQLLSRHILIKYDASKPYHVNLMGLIFDIILMTITGFLVRLIPFLLPLPNFGSKTFNPKDMITEIRGTVLVTPTFMIYFMEDIKSFMSLFTI